MKDWTETVLMFFFLCAAVLVLGAVGALMMGLMSKLGIL
jgi:hypothetical protein